MTRAIYKLPFKAKFIMRENMVAAASPAADEE